MHRSLKNIWIIALIWLTSITNICQAQDLYGSQDFPDFNKCFQLLDKNRQIYNRYNDSIFILKNRDAWVNFFRRRALKNQQLFAANREIISTITDYFDKGTRQIPQEAYHSLYLGVKKLNGDQTIDPFLGNRLCDYLLDYYNSGRCPDSLNFTNNVHVFKGVYQYEMFILGQDSTYIHTSYQCFKQVMEGSKKHLPDYLEATIMALDNLTVTNWLTAHMQSIAEYKRNVHQLLELVKLPEARPLFAPTEFRRIVSDVKNSDERLLRNVYLADTSVMDKQHADSLMRVIVARNLKNPNLSGLSFSRTLLMQVKLGQLTAKQALKVADRNYPKVKKMIAKKRYTDPQLNAVLLPYLNYFYLNDISNVSLAKKRRRVKRMCDVIVMLYQHRKDQQYTNSYIKTLNPLITYPRAIKYLSEQERIYYLKALIVATQVPTYAHSVHVSMIADVLMKGVLRYKPELLIGALGDNKVDDVKHNFRSYLSFIHDASLYHDLGKNAIVSVVNNDYRPLSDKEFAIIRKHPQMGADLLKIAPSLYEKYHDTTLGHHKWYNGKGGYPDSFDNTKSTKRIMIDIVMLSDCMQAATERIGRNYKGDKNFDTVMGEFRRDAGSMYNPDLVELIDAHSDLAKKLGDLIDDGWIDIYYDIYSQYFM